MKSLYVFSNKKNKKIVICEFLYAKYFLISYAYLKVIYSTYYQIAPHTNEPT